MDMDEIIEAEYGSEGSFKWLPSSATMYDGDGKPVLCACGKPAGCGIMGKSAYVAYCSDCMYGSKETAKFVYRPPT